MLQRHHISNINALTKISNAISNANVVN